MKSAWAKYGIVLLLCLPLLFINIKSTHDWGDDFAQYIHQAINISHGISQMQTGYIYNPQFVLGPPSYPSGFPLLLLPVYTIFGNSIPAFDFYISLYLLALALLMFHFFRKHYSSLISGLMVLIFIYNPWTLNFKMEIMSEIPFTLLLLFCVLFYQKVKPFTYLQCLALGVLSGLLISIRNIGMVFILAVLFDGFHRIFMNRREMLKRKYNYNQIIMALIISLTGIFIYTLINKYIFPCTPHGIFSYSYSYNSGQPEHYILNNIAYNMAVFRAYFEPWNDQWQFISLLSGTMIFAFVILGMIKKMIEKFEFGEGLIILYLVAIFTFPISKAGFRYLFPIAPLLLNYGVIGIRCINIKSLAKPNFVVPGIAIVIFLSYQKGLHDIFQSQKNALPGPYEPESIQAFDYIIQHTPESSRFDFLKPRALALYTGRNAMSNRPCQSISEINQSLVGNGIEYILINDDISDDSLKFYVKNKERELTLIWNNPKYFLYKRNFAYTPSSETGISYWEDKIVNTENWREMVMQKAKNKNIPFHSMLYLDAKYMFETEKK